MTDSLQKIIDDLHHFENNDVIHGTILRMFAERLEALRAKDAADC